MKTLKAKIELNEEDLKDILAKYLGVKPSDVRFNVVKMQRDSEYVTAVITKEIDIPVDPAASREESAYEHYCPNNTTKKHGDYGDAGPYDKNLPCNKKKCDPATRASCCGCPEYFEYMKKKEQKGE